jgi:hypothetical protein
MAFYSSPIRREVRGDRYHQIPLLHQAQGELFGSPSSIPYMYERNKPLQKFRRGKLAATCMSTRGLKKYLDDVVVQIATWQSFHLFAVFTDKADRRWRLPTHGNGNVTGKSARTRP